MSEDANLLKEKAKKFQRKRKASGSPIQSSPLPSKRSRKPKKSFSFTDEISKSPMKKPKKNSHNKYQENYTKNLQDQIKFRVRMKDGNEGSKTESSKQQSAVKKPLADSTAISPTKEELRMMLEKQNKLLELYQSPSRQSSVLSSKIFQKRNESDSEESDKEVLRGEASFASDHDEEKDALTLLTKKILEDIDKEDSHQFESKTESDGTQDDTTLSPQLWGKNCGEPVVLLKNNIYCKKTIFDDAEDLSRKSATSFLRRLMYGVFKPDVILNLNCTYSGRPPLAQGKDKQLKKVEPLDPQAKRAIIEYCDAYATKKGWPKSNQSDLRVAMSQWIGYDDAVMIPTKSGKKFLLMINGYTYSQINYSCYWVCSSAKAQGCKAKVVRNSQGKVMQHVDTHTHPPPKYILSHDVQFIPTEKGKYILVLRGYTYSQVGGRFFYCSSKHMGCRARVRLMSGKLVASGDAHNHAPPSHARCGNGAFVQLRPRSHVALPPPVTSILPSPLTSPRAASLALHALSFPRIMPKTDLWNRSPTEEKKDQ